MKKLMFTIGMLGLMLTPDASASDSVALTPAPPLTSDKLTEIDAKMAEIRKSLRNPELTDDQMDELNGQLFDQKNARKAEIAAIEKANIAAKLKEQRDGKVKEFNAHLEAIAADAKVQASKATAEEKAASAETAKTSHEALLNAYLGSVPKAPTQSSENSGKSGETTAAILAAITANRAAGMSDKDNKAALVAAGYKAGTIWGILDKFKKENGNKD